MTVWLAIGCVGIGSFLLRFLPLVLAGRLAWSDRVGRALRHAGTAALVYVTVGAALGAGRHGPAAAAAAMVGMLVGLSLVVRGRRPLTVVTAGLLTAWLTGVITIAVWPLAG